MPTKLMTIRILLLGLVLLPVAAKALETDQFTVPEGPLADLGPRLGREVAQAVAEVAAELNGKYREALARAGATRSPIQKKRYQKEAARALSEAALAEAVYERLGVGLPECTAEIWLQKQKDKHLPTIFHVSYGESVYGLSMMVKPLLIGAVAPTANLYGVYVGTDKLGHFFQQGHEYHVVYRKAMEGGADEKQALRQVVEFGQGQEEGFYGQVLAGSYSSADLATNYAGLIFYLNLTHQVQVGSQALPPVLVRSLDGWRLNPEAAGDFLRPFVSEHFNEAMNPGCYNSGMRGFIRAKVRQRGDRWVAFYRTDRDTEVSRMENLRTWHGQDYGHLGYKDSITIVNAYFDPPAEVAYRPSRARPLVGVRTPGAR